MKSRTAAIANIFNYEGEIMPSTVVTRTIPQTNPQPHGMSIVLLSRLSNFRSQTLLWAERYLWERVHQSTRNTYMTGFRRFQEFVTEFGCQNGIKKLLNIKSVTTSKRR